MARVTTGDWLDRPGWPPTRSSVTYVGLVGVLVGGRALLVVVAPSDVPLASQSALLSWPAVVSIAVLGAVGLVLARRTAITESGSRGFGRGFVVRRTDGGWRATAGRYLEPTLVGLAAAAAFVSLDRVVALGIPHVPLPHAVPFYLSGAVAMEVLLRLVPLGVAAWLAASLGGGRRRQVGVFAAGAALTALVEPLGLLAVVAPRGGTALAAVFGVAYALNLAGAYLLWRIGFLAAVVERAVFYLIWHVAYGGLA